MASLKQNFVVLFYLRCSQSVDFGVSELKWHGSADTNYTPTGQSDTRHDEFMTPVMTPWRARSAQIHMQSATSIQWGTCIASAQGDALQTIPYWSYVEPSRPEQGPAKLQIPSELVTQCTRVAHFVCHFIAVVPQTFMYDLTQWGRWQPDNRGDTCDRRWRVGWNHDTLTSDDWKVTRANSVAYTVVNDAAS